MTDRPMLTPDEIAHRLNIKLRTAYEYLAPGGKLHHLRVQLGPKTIRVDPDRFEQFLKQGAPDHASS